MRFWAFSCVAVAPIVACAGAAPPPAPMAVPTPSTSTSPAPISPAPISPAPISPAPTSTSPTSTPPSTEASPSPRLCGCFLCEPLPSDDACTTDADCAPAVPCHARACVAAAKAERRKPGEMCSMQMVCGTTDANACGCVAGKCSLYPRRKS